MEEVLVAEARDGAQETRPLLTQATIGGGDAAELRAAPTLVPQPRFDLEYLGISAFDNPDFTVGGNEPRYIYENDQGDFLTIEQINNLAIVALEKAYQEIATALRESESGTLTFERTIDVTSTISNQVFTFELDEANANLIITRDTDWTGLRDLAGSLDQYQHVWTLNRANMSIYIPDSYLGGSEASPINPNDINLADSRQYFDRVEDLLSMINLLNLSETSAQAEEAPPAPESR